MIHDYLMIKEKASGGTEALKRALEFHFELSVDDSLCFLHSFIHYLDDPVATLAAAASNPTLNQNHRLVAAVMMAGRQAATIKGGTPWKYAHVMGLLARQTAAADVRQGALSGLARLEILAGRFKAGLPNHLPHNWFRAGNRYPSPDWRAWQGISQEEAAQLWQEGHDVGACHSWYQSSYRGNGRLIKWNSRRAFGLNWCGGADSHHASAGDILESTAFDWCKPIGVISLQ